MVQKLNNSPNFPTLSNPDQVISWSLAFINAITRELVYNANRANSLFPEDGTESMTAPAPLLVSTFAGLPSAATYPGGIAYASDSVGIAFSDGATWHLITASSGTTAWASITGTPTTLSGYGITDANFSVKVTTFTASGTWTPDAKMRYALIEGWGGGGGGGGCANSGASTVFLGGGGGAGSKSEVTVSKATAGASQVVTIGALGAGGATGNNTGITGGDTSVGTLLVAKGALGGNGNPSTSTVSSFAVDGVGQTGGTGDVVGVGETGEHSAGGSASPVGAGGLIRITQGTGNAAQGRASGGGGGFTALAGGTAAGGAGTAGFVKITEYLFG